MTLLVFSSLLLVAMLWSDIADRSVLSAAVLFLAAGIAFGASGTDWIELAPAVASSLAHYALVSVLYADSMQLGIRELREAWRLPGRALLFGMPLTFAVMAVSAHYLAALGWTEAMLLAAVLSPTDPVFASAIVGRTEIPRRLRLLLNVESGVNDALALPAVVLLLGTLTPRPERLAHIALELLLGAAIGVGVPMAVLLVERTRVFSVARSRQSLFALALGLFVMALADGIGANTYLAAFFAGFTLAAMRPDLREAFHVSGENLTELLKLSALLAFGAAIQVNSLRTLGVGSFAFVAIALLIARPAGLIPALWRSGMSWPERLTAAWFGPKGFASVVFGLLVLHARIAHGDTLFLLVSLVIVVSIVAHSTSDVPIAEWFRRRERRAARDPVPERTSQ